MRRYIDVDELKRKINEHECYSYDPEVSRICELINDAPTLDVEPVRHGHWLLDSSGAEFCSECGEYPFDDGEYHISGWSSKYCPHCGAKMDEEEQENK